MSWCEARKINLLRTFVFRMNELSKYKEQIRQLCDLYSVKALFAFGSVTTDRFKDDSDIDLIVEINSNDPVVYADNYFSLKSSLEQLFKRKIDLLEEKAVKNPFLKQKIDQTKVLVYGTGN